MARIKLPHLSDMLPEQKRAYDEAVAGRRGHAPAPMTAWLKNPEFARRAQKLGEFIRFEMTLPARLRELAILVVARYWFAHHEWRVHKKIALEAGIDADTVQCLAARRRPGFTENADRVVYEIAISLLECRTVPESLYQEGIRELGEKGVVELVGVLGYYTLVSMTLVTFEVGLPEDFQSEFADNASSAK
ncbi:MAG: carboxymuconolactone decarboxylase family protein [Candidatus Acidiferrales bacterium]